MPQTEDGESLSVRYCEILNEDTLHLYRIGHIHAYIRGRYNQTREILVRFRADNTFCRPEFVLAPDNIKLNTRRAVVYDDWQK